MDSRNPFKLTNNSPTDSLVIDPAGIGIGTALPGNDLDIRSENPTIALTDVTGTFVNRVWEINSNPQASTFDIRDVTLGVSPLRIISPALDAAIVVDSTGVTLSSSRTVKRNVEPAVSSALLEEVAQLPIYTWSYASDGTGALHVGPMAEDFYRRFGLGADERRISSLDTAGVALAAIQALHQKLEQRDAEIAELKAAVRQLLAGRAE